MIDSIKIKAIVVCALACTLLPAYAQKRLTILHTNDTHSCVLPMNPNLSDKSVAGRGGYLRRITLINEERTKDPDLLYIDSGDFSQGSSYYTLFKGDVEVQLMNEMGCDASTIGNHEWDYGLENLLRNARMAKFPFICSNYDFKGTELEDVIKPYTIIKRNGLKIGIFALCPPLEGLVFAGNCKGVTYNDPIACGLEMGTFLKKKKKCDVVICISHLGWDERGDIGMIKGSRNIDIVLGGHSHSYFTELQYAKDLDGKDVPADQNGKSGIYVGKIVLELDK